MVHPAYAGQPERRRGEVGWFTEPPVERLGSSLRGTGYGPASNRPYLFQFRRWW